LVVDTTNPNNSTNQIAEMKTRAIPNKNKVDFQSKAILQYDGQVFVNVPGSISKILTALEVAKVLCSRGMMVKSRPPFDMLFCKRPTSFVSHPRCSVSRIKKTL
jgi:hypothetical protein